MEKEKQVDWCRTIGNAVWIPVLPNELVAFSSMWSGQREREQVMCKARNWPFSDSNKVRN